MVSDDRAELDGYARRLLDAAQRNAAEIVVHDEHGAFQFPPEIVLRLASRAAPRNPRQFDETRTTAYGLLRYAWEYLEAARLVSASRNHEYSPVASMLLAHSIELALKAYLRARGAPLAELMGLGHRLGKIYAKAHSRGLGRFVKLPADLVGVIDMIDRANDEHQFRYIQNGSFQLPGWGSMSLVAQMLTKSLQRYCYRRTFGKASEAKFFSVPKNRWR